MPPPRPNRAPPPRAGKPPVKPGPLPAKAGPPGKPSAPLPAKAAPPPPPPTLGTVKPSTRIAAAKPPVPPKRAPPPPPALKTPAPPPVQSRPATRVGTVSTRRGSRPPPRPHPEVDDIEVDDGQLAAPVATSPGTRRTEALRAKASGDKRRLILILGGAALALIAVIALSAAWNPMKRSRQLAALDACRDPAQLEAALELASQFASEWGERSDYVVAAITSGRGPFEARVRLCRAGKHLRLLAQMLGDDQLTPAQRGLVCAALSELWPDDGSGPGVSPSLPAWALDPASDPALAEPALRLLVAMAPLDAEVHLSRAAADGNLSDERAVSVAVSLGLLLEKRNLGVAPLLTALGGAHRAALLASAPVAEVVRNNALPADAGKLLALLEKPDSVALGLAGLGGKRFQLSDSDGKERAELAQQLAPFLVADQDDAVLAGALLVVHRQRLIGSASQVIALLPRLATRRPAQLSKDDLADLLARSLVSARTPEAATVAGQMITALTEALDRTETRVLAIVALSRVQEASIPALRIALDGLAAYGDDGAAALGILVGTVYKRDDIVTAARRGSWSTVLAEDRRKRARYEGIQRWLADHGAESNARVDSEVMAANKAELGRMRDEIRGWSESNQPLPLGVTKASLDDLANKVQVLLYSVLKGTHAD